MNPMTKALSWIDILLHPGNDLRGHGQGKHANGSKPSPNAAKKRLLRNKRQRQARQAHYKRMK